MNKNLINTTLKGKLRAIDAWILNHLIGLFVFNMAIILMALLNTAQYFKPFFYLGINTIFLLSLILATIFLGARTKAMFTISLVFLVFAALLKIAKIDIWADRASIYFYQAFFIGLSLLFLSP